MLRSNTPEKVAWINLCKGQVRLSQPQCSTKAYFTPRWQSFYLQSSTKCKFCFIFKGMRDRDDWTWPLLPKVGQSKARSKEFLLSFPSGCRNLRAWTNLCCFPKSLTGSWLWSGAARTRIYTHLRGRCHQQRISMPPVLFLTAFRKWSLT